MSKIIKYENITPDQITLIKSQIAVDATDDELKLFLHVANKSGLDPLARQIYFIKRGGKMTIMTAIDGFRAIADRTGQYIGSSDPIFEDNGSIPAKATVTVNKVVSGVVGNFTATARWDEYYPGKSQGFMWDKMPHTMLGKCAEALALRKAFPAQLSGLYTGDEMDQAQNDGKPNNDPPKEVNPTGGSEQLKEILTENPDKIDPEPSEEEMHEEIFNTALDTLEFALGINYREVDEMSMEAHADENPDTLMNMSEIYTQNLPDWQKELSEMEIANIKSFCTEIKQFYLKGKEVA